MTSATLPVAAAADARRGRYIAELLAMHERMSLRCMLDHVEPLYFQRRGDGRAVLTVRHSDLPERYQLGIYGFRLAQYLRIRLASERIAFQRSLFAEPIAAEREEIHVLSLDERSGGIVQYVSIVGTADPRPRSVRDPERTPFPCEIAHRIRLFDRIPRIAAVGTDEIWEIKRLVQRGQLPDQTLDLRLRLSLELMHGFYSTLHLLRPSVKYLVGDGEEGLAIQRLSRSLREIIVLEGTSPWLPEDDLLAPAYVERAVVKPFVAAIPEPDRLGALVTRLDEALAMDNPLAGFKHVVNHVQGTIRRIRI
ncbi:hypothetical protein [Nocardia macrotermitis]|uniref:Uncharacterized protein n=1 Tax=Nocardia macrotermitis TaxID=2585198 RepID=A0A7K0DA18_9NOCA|nr:hypothetical protein [Nocardia macrotermitis]MQY22610.1 hypothetical protein [Nocardia macrotermitis]